MDAFERLYNNAKSLDLNKELELWLDDNNEFITNLNKKRLFEKGTDVEGKEIRTKKAASGEVYSGFTIEMKDKAGQPFDRVTLKDTGAFYPTFKVDSGSNSFLIEADDKKPDGNISDNVDVESALGLDAEDIELLQQKLILHLQAILLDGLQL